MSTSNFDTGLGEVEVRAAFHDAVAALRSPSLTPRFGVELYNVCSGGEPDTLRAASIAFTMRARLDKPANVVSTEQDASNLIGEFASHGWIARSDRWAPNGIHAGSDRWTLHLTRGKVVLRLNLSGASPIVLINVSGPCLEPNSEAADWIEQQVTVDVAIPGAVALS
jgi:hypothetical protein